MAGGCPNGDGRRDRPSVVKQVERAAMVEGPQWCYRRAPGPFKGQEFQPAQSDSSPRERPRIDTDDPADVVAVGMRQDDAIDQAGIDADGCQRIQQVPAPGPAEIAWTDPRIDQDERVIGGDQETADRSVDGAFR